MAVSPLSAEVPSRVEVPADARFEAARRALVERVAGGELPSIAVAVVDGGEVVWEETIGWADREGRRGATPRSVYGLGSMGKSVLATAVLVLVEEGRLDLDAPVTEALGDVQFRAFGGGVDSQKASPTIRQTLQMAGGIPHGHVIYYGDGHTAPTAREIAERYAVGALPPGKYFEYSNFAYGLLEQVIEATTGESYADFVRRAVFEPLGMQGSSVGVAGEDWAVRYGRSGSPVGTMVAGPVSSLGTQSTLHDLLQYGLFHLGRGPEGQRPILSREMLRLAHTDRPGVPGARLALGWGVLDMEASTVLVSNGLVSGASSALFLVPERQSLVLVLSNISSNGVTDDIGFELLDRLVPGLLEEFDALRRSVESSEAEAGVPLDELLGEWKGEVALAEQSVPLELLFQPDGDVHVRLAEQLRTLLDEQRWEGPRLVGRFLGSLPWEETGGATTDVDLVLYPESGRIIGFAAASYYTGEVFHRLPAPFVLLPTP